MSLPTVREAVANFLRNTASYNKTLVDWWNPSLETQVQVVSDIGDPTDFGGYTKDGDTWYSIRWPKNGKTDPTWSDYTQKFDLSKYAEFIGSSGWNFETLSSHYVCFDLDSADGHASGLTESELQFFIEKGTKCPYIDVVRSTSGRGLHYYVRFDPDSLPPATNRVEHKTVALYILSRLKADVDESIITKLDVCGNIFWFWSRNMVEKSYEHLSKAEHLLRFDEFEDGWRDKAEQIHKPYVPTRSTTSYFGASPIDAKHKEILKALSESGFYFSFDLAERRVTTHTKAFENVAKLIPTVGAFSTKSLGTDTRQNCFAFPVDNGGFTVFRFGNVTEEFPWKLSSNKNYYALFNSPLEPVETFLHFRMEHQPKQGTRKERFCTQEYSDFQQALEFLGCEYSFTENIQQYIDSYYIELTPSTDNSLKICVDSQDKVALKNIGMVEQGRNHYKTKLLTYKYPRFGTYQDTKKAREESLMINKIMELTGIEHLARHTKQDAIYGITNTQEGEWWVGTDLPFEGHTFCKVKSDSDVVKVLQTEYSGLPADAAKLICGDLLRKPWVITCLPFAPEYPRDRTWNMNAPKFAFKPADLDDCEEAYHPTWDAILSHCGQEITSVIKDQPWYDYWGIRTGKEYLTAWIACMLFEPAKKLPYLFLHGHQHTGKSTLHEAIRLLMVRGDQDGSRALTNTSSFNGELDGKVLIFIEEIDLSRHDKDKNIAYERIKDWTVSPTLSIRHLYRPPYTAKNFLHFIQVANKISACPVDQDDTRITALLVPPFTGETIPVDIRNKRLEDEAPHFMVTLHRAFRRLPPMDGRLRLPVVHTHSKEQVIDALSNPLVAFIREYCAERPTKYTQLSKFYRMFLEKSPADVHEQSWGINDVKRELLNAHYSVEGSGDAATVKGLVFWTDDNKKDED